MGVERLRGGWSLAVTHRERDDKTRRGIVQPSRRRDAMSSSRNATKTIQLYATDDDASPPLSLPLSAVSPDDDESDSDAGRYSSSG